MKKKKVKEKIINILFAIILMLGSYKLVADVKRVVNLGVRTKIILSEKEEKLAKENIEKLEKNVEKINNLKEGNYTKDEIKKLQTSYKNILEKEEDIYKFLTSSKRYNSMEIYNGFNPNYYMVSEKKIYDILHEHKNLSEREYNLYVSNLKGKWSNSSAKRTYNIDILEETGKLKFMHGEIFSEIRSYLNELEYYNELSNLILESEVINNEK